MAAFVVRVAAWVALDRADHPEVWENETIAANLLAGRGFTFDFLGTTYYSYMEPLYPGLCALVYRLTGHGTVVMGLVQALLGAALVGLVFACGRRLVHERVALLAAGAAALHPGLILYTTKLHPFALDALLLLGVVTACVAYAPHRPWRSSIVLGSLLGLCVLSRPTVLACAPLVAWWVVRAHAADRRRAGMSLALIAACAGLIVAPWVWRNARIHHRFMLTRSGTSYVFWLGNNPHRFTGSAMTPEGKAIIDTVPDAIRAHLLTLDELGQQEFFRQEAQRYVREHPVAFLARWAIKWWYFWWQTPQAGLRYPPGWMIWYQWLYAGLLGSVAFGVMVGWRVWQGGVRPDVNRAGVGLLLGVCGSIALLQSLYYVEGRHRLAIEPMLLIVGAYGFEQIIRLFRRDSVPNAAQDATSGDVGSVETSHAATGVR